MPFDFTPSILTTPSLEALSYALRHPEVWPPGFEWDYGKCHQCAMGLAYKLWGKIVISPTIRHVASAMVMSIDDTFNIFWNGNGGDGFDYDTITPDHVADWIDEYIRERA